MIRSVVFKTIFTGLLSVLAIGQILGQTPDTGAQYPRQGQDYFLEQVGNGEPGSDDNGCHGQGIKFDGSFFYSSCMDTSGSDTAYLFVHDRRGKLIRKFQNSSTYQHPSGIRLENGWAYVAFSHNGLNMYSVLYRFNGLGTVQNQGNYSHSVGFVDDQIQSTNGATKTATTRYVSYDQFYERNCQALDGTCGSFRDALTLYNINSASSDGVQDCDLYFKDGGWYKACILFSSSPSRIRVWNAREHKLGPNNALATISLTGQPGHSGGMGFYTDPSGSKWIVTAPPPGTNRRYCQGCALVGGWKCACTDQSNRQRVRFIPFDSFQWPGGPN